MVLSACPRPPIDLVNWFLVYITMVFAAIGALLLGITLSITLALWWRNRYAAEIATLIVLIALIFLFFFRNVSPIANDPSELVSAALPYTLLVYVAMICIALVARQIARQRP